MKCLCFSQNVCIFKFNYTGHTVNEWVMKNTGMYWNIRCCWFQLVPTFLRLFSNHNMTRLKTAWNTVYNCCHKSCCSIFIHIQADKKCNRQLAYSSTIHTQYIYRKPTERCDNDEYSNTHTHTHTHTHLTALFPWLPGWAGTTKVKPIWILLKQETVSGSGISWTICKTAPRSRQITTPAPHHSIFYRPDALPAAQATVSKH